VIGEDKTMKLRILPFLGVVALLSCDRSTNDASDTSGTRAISARVTRDASVTESLFDSASAVHVKLTTTSGTQLANDTVLFSKHTIPTVSAPSDQGVVVAMEGLSNTLAVIWSGSVTLPPSTRDTSFAITVGAVSASGSGSTFAGTVNAPTFDSSSVKAWSTGTFDQPVHVYLSSTTPGATIHYTLDGSYPTAASSVYGDTGVLVDSSRTLKAIAVLSGWTNSALLTQSIVLQAQAVIIAADGNVGWPPFKIGMSSKTSGVVIHYAKNGNVPTVDSARYSDSLAFGKYDDSITYTAIAVDTLHPNVATSKASSGRFGPIAPWNSSVTYGSLTDDRDQQVYRTVTIGTQTWMAENLNYKTDSSWCYDNDTSYCRKYGRLYQWSAAMGLASTYNSTSWSGTLPHQGACPSGWHVPSDAEWSTLVQYVDSATSGTKLKSTSGWSSNTGTDAYGFRVLPAGNRDGGGASIVVGINAYFWSSSESYASDAWNRYFSDDSANVARLSRYRALGFSSRCLEN
jgi:uncharacterized protein (TIGR02145 family)